MVKGKLYLIPTTLGECMPAEVLPQGPLSAIMSVTTFVVEEVRSARRFLSACGLKGKIDNLTFYELNEHTSGREIEDYLKLFDNGDVGLLSEAGLPAVADPGSLLVDLCHRNDIEVVPFTGPSSLMLALMSSGMNGQCFAFNGYLPIKQEQRKESLKKMERRSSIENQTQIFIETPYRNDSLFKDILSSCKGDTKICIAFNLTLPGSFIKTKTVAEWKNEPVEIGKNPCVFLLLA